MTPTFPEALRAAEEKLSRSLGRPVRVAIHRRATPELIDAIESIDRAMFREELRYTRKEIEADATKSDYTAITAETDAVMAVSYGYADEGGYMLDTLATRVEGKGVGPALATLTVIYAAERGYRVLTLYTEEEDERGRRLREWYGRSLGFRYLRTETGKGDVMALELTPGVVDGLFSRYILAHP